MDIVITTLNDLGVECVDVINAYITAPIEENLWKTLGPEFGPEAGKIALVVYALYVLKSIGDAFCAHLGWCMQGIVYEPYIDDPDLWIKSEVRPDGGYEY